MPERRTWNHFTDQEVEGLQHDFIEKLDIARKIAGIPFVIKSGFRTLEKNQSLRGAVADSAHTKGLAVDLRVYSSEEAGIICDALADAGILRRGIYISKSTMQPVHVHCDVDPDKQPERCIYVRFEEN